MICGIKQGYFLIIVFTQKSLYNPEMLDNKTPDDISRFQSILDSKMPTISDALSAYANSQAKILERFAIPDYNKLISNIQQHNLPPYDNDVRDFFINLDKVFLFIENILNCIKAFPDEEFNFVKLEVLEKQFHYLKKYREAFVQSYGFIYDNNEPNL